MEFLTQALPSVCYLIGFFILSASIIKLFIFKQTKYRWLMIFLFLLSLSYLAWGVYYIAQSKNIDIVVSIFDGLSTLAVLIFVKKLTEGKKDE